jgi:hypothetical protein
MGSRVGPRMHIYDVVGTRVMDQESVGFFSVLLIVTAITLTHPFQLGRNVLPSLPEIHWQALIDNAARAAGIDQDDGESAEP